jgi:tetraacyldisaccharide 4'-kinase
MLLNKAFFFLNSLWEKSFDFSQFFFHEKIIFIFLCFLEYCYRLGFFFVVKIKKRNGDRRLLFKVVSVGNISAGGTGKSVFAAFLIQNIRNYKGAILLRGYKSTAQKKSFFVSKGEGLLCSSGLAGDEASMFATKLSVPVVVGANRYDSGKLLENFSIKNRRQIDFVVLDDAYQNYQLKKDFEILLLDARKPFENGHCLPAGKLREKDYTRADVIILTHADDVDSCSLINIRKKLSSKIIEKNIFTGKHSVVGIYNSKEEKVSKQFFDGKKVCVIAGIGSFEQFVESIKKIHINVFSTIQYPDHYLYVRDDLIDIADSIRNNKYDVVITTRKDWQKIKPFLKQDKNINSDFVFILDICFEFLSKEEKILFFDIFHNKLRLPRL